MNGRRLPSDLLDREHGKVRVLSGRCPTCIFRRGNLMHLAPGRFEQVVKANVDAGALLTCHSTLPYGPHPEFGPAVCAGFWAQYAPATLAGWIAEHVIGVIRVPPPGDGEPR